MDIFRTISKQVCIGACLSITTALKALKTTAIDSLHHNITSANATSFYHGTTISIFQHAETLFQSATLRKDTTNIETNREILLEWTLAGQCISDMISESSNRNPTTGRY